MCSFSAKERQSYDYQIRLMKIRVACVLKGQINRETQSLLYVLGSVHKGNKWGHEGV